MADCAPRFATPRTPGRKTLGTVAARIANQLGTPLMPWQREVADVALELREDGKLAYREVVVHVPRQQGKSRLLLVAMLTRALAESRQGIRYSAQSGVMARSKLVDEWLPELQQSPLGSMFSTRLVNGHETLRFTNDSRIELVATTRKSAHGLTIDLGLIDEAFALADARLEQALKPAMVTRPSPQLWICSTAGTPGESPYLWSKVETGRALSAIDGGTAYFEWAAGEDDDPAGPATWASCMPALGHTIDVEAIRADFQSMALPEFQRAYLNMWTAPLAEPLIPLERWRELYDPDESPPVEVLALDASPLGTTDTSVIAAAGRRSDGRIAVGVVEYGGGRGWVPARAADLFQQFSPRKVMIDDKGPLSEMEEELIGAGVRRIVKTSYTDMTKACEGFARAVDDGTLTHHGNPELEAALRGAAKRPLGDSWALKRRGSSSDICPLVACVLAHYGVRRPTGIPLHVFGLEDWDEVSDAG